MPRDAVRRCIAPGCREATEGDRLYCDRHHSCTLEGDERPSWAETPRRTNPGTAEHDHQGVRMNTLGD